MRDDSVFMRGSEEKLADVIIKYKPTENVGGNATDEKELTLGVMNYHYTGAPSDQDIFIASVVEFALILRDSQYKAEANLEELITQLEGLDLSGDEFKTEFREMVKKYAQSQNDEIE
jgi:hypothetical protein